MPTSTYKKAGVDIDRADAFVKSIMPLIRKTERPGVIGGVGGFSGLFKPEIHRIKTPVLVSATDGVGTKILVAEHQQKFDTLGIDLVAMCANDVVVTGAEPLFFLDYIACGRLDNAKHYALMKGIARGCQQAGCALLGGETAELPGMYDKGKYDLAGFAVGIVDRDKIIDGSLCRPGDQLLGLASTGLHSNGFSLVRKIFSREELKGEMGRELLKPTRIYVKTILKLKRRIRIMAVAHITGGGFFDNIPRVLPPGLEARIRKDAWPVPRIFKKIQRKGEVAENEMFRVFNMGIGMVLIVSPRSVQSVLDILSDLGQKAWIIGEVHEGKSGVKLED